MASAIQDAGELVPVIDDSDPLGPPRRIGRYEIRKELGRGMMGVVYEAHDPALDRTIALKTIELAFAVSPAEREAFDQRFFAEARSVARLSHPGIVGVHDAGRDSETGMLFIAFEYLQGRTLAEIAKDGSPPEWRDGLRIVAKVAEALHHAHSKGVIHRDIKPANIMLLPSGEPKIMDFGIAKIETARIQLTSSGQFFGTPLYMSPEQALGHTIDARSDLFSLGAIAYTLLTGQLAFWAENIPKMVERLLNDDPAAPSILVSGLAKDVDYVIGRSLAKEASERYLDGKALVEDIEDVLGGRSPRHRNAPPAAQPVEATLVSRGHHPGAAGANARATIAKESPAAPVAEPPGTSVDLESMFAALVEEPTRAPEFPALAGSPTTKAVRASRADAAPPFRNAPASREPRGHSRRILVTTLVALAILVVGALVVALLYRQAELVPTDPSVVSSLPPTPARAAAASPAATSSVPLRPTTEEAATTPTTPPQPSDTPSPAQPDTAVPSAKATQLFIDFEHPLKSGTVRIWLDRDQVLEEDLESRVSKSVVGLKFRKGGIEKLLDVAPGRHEVRAKVTWDDNEKAATIVGTFKSGSTRYLEVRIGRLRKNLSLEWK